MKIEGIHLDGPGTQLQPVGPVVEVTAVKGTLPDLFRGQRLTATVLEGNGTQILVNVQGSLFTLPLSSPLKPGSEILLRVTSLAPQLQLEVLPTPAHSQSQLLPLSLGQLVDVEILDQLPNGHMRVNVQGAILEAAFTAGLPTNTRVQATVEQLTPQFMLRVLTSPEDPVQTEALHILRNTIAHHAPTSEALQTLLPTLTALATSPAQEALPANAAKLLNLLNTLLPQDGGPPTAERLAAFVHDSGLLYETKLQQAAAHNPSGFAQVAENDVKGLLLQLTRDLEKARTTSPSSSAAAQQQPISEESAEASVLRNTQQQELLQTLNKHLEHIESQQAVNVLARSQEEAYQLQIPFFTGQEMTTAFLAINPERKGQEETAEHGSSTAEQGYHILFLLDLEKLGQTRIEARIGSKSIWGAFYVEHTTSVAELQAELPAFRTTLQGLGYEEVLLIAKPLEQLAPEKRKKFDVLASGIPSSIHLLDMRA